MQWLFGGSDNSDYERYAEERRKRLLEEQRVAREEQAAIDAIEDPEARKVENRKRYKCGAARAVTVADIPPWSAVAPSLAENPKHTTAGSGADHRSFSFGNDQVTFKREDLLRQKNVSNALNGKISIFQGDITHLEIDGIVNAANQSLMGGGGIDGAIHSAAGSMLQAECEPLGGAETGETKITRGYKLPAQYVLHTVGPIGGGDAELQSCYKTSLALVRQHNLRSIAFCCVSTGIFGFPLVRATHIALRVIREWLEEEGNADAVDRIIFCVFRNVELETYEKLIPVYFPIENYPAEALPDDVQVPGPEPPRARFGGMGGGGGMMGMGGGGMGMRMGGGGAGGMGGRPGHI